MRRDPSTGFLLFRLAAFVWLLAILPLALLILCVADTWNGRWFALGSTLAAILPAAIVRQWQSRSRPDTIGLTGLGLAFAAIAAGVIFASPSRQPTDRRVANHYRFGQDSGSPMVLSNWLPEEDQLLAGFTLATAIDPLLTSGQATELRGLTRTVYRELERDPAFHELGSSMGFTYEAMLTGPAAIRHGYTYVPPKLDRTKPAPVLVFFHGSGGNFKAYLWVLAKLADQLGCVLVAPTGGVGNWTDTESAEALRFALEAAARVATVDSKAVHIAGLSNGGRALCHLIEIHGSELASVAFISPVFDQEAVQSLEFAAHCRGKQILVISGGTDNRAPIAYVAENVATMTAFGAPVRFLTYADADHFLILSHCDALLKAMATWYTDTGS